MEPLVFHPVFQERIWGGRALEELLGKPLPVEGSFGESWEVTDRPEAQSVVASGPLAGTELSELWRGQRERLFGARAREAGPRFPLLVKLLDARETLSVQVHPPAHVAPDLGGEPKDELWCVLAAEPGAHLYAGLAAGVTEKRFRAALEVGEDVSELLHRVEVRVGDTLWIPSGRVHALGAGCLVVEVQQNSDTTYRVWDFERPGADGQPRELHVAESLACIDCSDVEPELRRAADGVVVANEHVTVTRRTLDEPERLTAEGECALVAVLTGVATCGSAQFGPGAFFLVPADAGAELAVAGSAEVLVIELP